MDTDTITTITSTILAANDDNLLAQLLWSVVVGDEATEEERKALLDPEEEEWEDVMPQIVEDTFNASRISTRERWVRMQDSDIKNPSHPNAPYVWQRAHNETSNCYYTTSGDNIVTKSVDEQVDQDQPNKLMRLQCPDKRFYSQSKELTGRWAQRLREMESLEHEIIRFFRTHLGDGPLQRKAAIRFEKLVINRCIRRKRVKGLRAFINRCLND